MIYRQDSGPVRGQGRRGRVPAPELKPARPAGGQGRRGQDESGGRQSGNSQMTSRMISLTVGWGKMISLASLTRSWLSIISAAPQMISEA